MASPATMETYSGPTIVKEAWKKAPRNPSNLPRGPVVTYSAKEPGSCLSQYFNNQALYFETHSSSIENHKRRALDFHRPDLLSVLIAKVSTLEHTIVMKVNANSMKMRTILPLDNQNSASPYHFTANRLMIAYSTMQAAQIAARGILSDQYVMTTFNADISNGMRIASYKKKFQPTVNLWLFSAW